MSNSSSSIPKNNNANDAGCAVAYATPTFADWAHKVFQLPTSSSCIFLGPFQSASDSPDPRCCQVRQSIHEHNVTAIVNCTQDAPCCHPDMVEYCRVPVRDECGADILPYLWGVTTFMHLHLTGQRNRVVVQQHPQQQEKKEKDEGQQQQQQQPQSVLVHCEMGISRSTTVVLAYLIRYQQMTKENAYEMVKQCRPQARPNAGFWKQLGEFEQMVLLQQQQQQQQQHQNGQNHNSSSSLKIEEKDERTLLYEWAKLSSATFITTVGVGNSIHLLRGKQISYHNNNNNNNNNNNTDIKAKNVAVFTGGEATLKKDVFSQHVPLLLQSNLRNIKTTKESLEKLVTGALDYVWSRGVLYIDLYWLKALVDFLQQRLDDDKKNLLQDGDVNILSLLSSDSSLSSVLPTVEFEKMSDGENNQSSRENIRVMEILMKILQEEDSDFCQSWSGEIYDDQIQRVKKVLKN